MINIIKSGKYGKTFQAECPECGCVFSFTRDDVGWSRPVLEHYLNCPECKHTVYVGDLDKLDRVEEEE